MTERSVSHATFTIERTYDSPPPRVFNAFADPVAKRRWFAEGEGWEVEAFDADFRVGGTERSRFRFRGGPLIRNDTVYQDIVPDQRIIIAYAMTIGENRISASLATMQFEPAGSGTRLTFTEQGAFLDGYDDAGRRESGTKELLDALGKELERQAKRPAPDIGRKSDMPSSNKADIVRSLFAAYLANDRHVAERLLADDFTFTSPYDDAIDKAAYFERCWPTSERVGEQVLEKVVGSGDDVFVLYRCRTKDGKAFRNTEVIGFDGDCINRVNVYFGAAYRDGVFVSAQRHSAAAVGTLAS